MTGRTHDLTAFTALNLVFSTQSIPEMTLATAVVAFGANMIGGLLPDIDNATSDIWDKIRGGEILGRIIKPFIGQHRKLSHSLLGMAIAGYTSWLFLSAIGTVLLVDMQIVWWSVIIGYASHLLADSMTTQGIPLFFPFSYKFGIPPIRSLRIKTGGFSEKLIVFPGLLLLNGYLIYIHYEKYLDFFRVYLK